MLTYVGSPSTSSHNNTAATRFPPSSTTFTPPIYMQDIDACERFVFYKDTVCDDTTRTADAEVAGVRWRLLIDTDYDGYVYRFFLHCLDETHLVDRWDPESNNFLLKFTRVGGKPKGKTTCYRSPLSKSQWEGMLTDSGGYLAPDGSITVEVRWSFVRRAHFYFDRPMVSTFSLVIEGRRLFVSKDLLATYSEYFFGLFYGDDEQPPYPHNALELHDVGYEAMLEVLNVHPPANYPVHLGNARRLMLLANRFGFTYVARKCAKRFGAFDAYPELADVKLHTAALHGLHCLKRWEAIDARSRFALVVDGDKEIHVSRELLALHSPYFYGLFYDAVGADQDRPRFVGYTQFDVELMLNLTRLAAENALLPNCNDIAFDPLFELGYTLKLGYISLICTRRMEEDLRTVEGDRESEQLKEHAIICADRYELHSLRCSAIFTNTLIHPFSDYEELKDDLNDATIEYILDVESAATGPSRANF